MSGNPNAASTARSDWPGSSDEERVEQADAGDQDGDDAGDVGPAGPHHEGERIDHRGEQSAIDEQADAEPGCDRQTIDEGRGEEDQRPETTRLLQIFLLRRIGQADQIAERHGGRPEQIARQGARRPLPQQ